MSGILKQVAGESPEQPSDYARFLELCAAQLATAVEDAKHKADLVSRAAITTAGRLAELGAAGSAEAADAAEQMNGLFVHLQFADRLDQQVSNVRKNLLLLAAHAGDSGSWDELVEQARQSYTMEDERRAFDAAFGLDTACSAQEADSVQLFAADDGDA